MTVTIDLNVILDMFLRRGEYAACLELLTLCRNRKLIGTIPSHGLPTIYYVIRKQKGHAEALRAITYFLEFLEVFPIDARALQQASVTDFEDAVVSIAAEKSGAEYIITNNTKDFLTSKVAAISPEQFLKRFIG